MDILGGKTIVWFSREHLKKHFSVHSDDFQTKIGRELFSAYALSMFLLEKENREYRIGLPLKNTNRRSNRPVYYTISQFIQSPSLRDDSDVDYILGYGAEHPVLYFIQNVRLCRMTNDSLSTSDLIAIIQKKCRVQQDDKLTLFVNVEVELSANIDDIQAHLQNLRIPYGAVFVMGKTDRNRNRFRIFKIHPSFCDPVEVTLL